jgi:energy-converting hydrogenase Eha subunit A
MQTILQNFFSDVEGSIKGSLNAEELYRSILTSLGSATSVGFVLGVLQAVLTNVATIFPNPTVAALATGLLTLVVDLLRRQSQGTTPSPAPTPTPAPAPASN